MVGQIRMGICDDEKYAHDMVEEYIKQICLENKIALKFIIITRDRNCLIVVIVWMAYF